MLELIIAGEFTKPPAATLLVAVFALLVNVVSSLIRRRFTDIEKMKRVQREVREFNAELRRAIMSRDKAKEEKLRKKQKKMSEMQMKMMSENFRTSMYFMLPFLLVWWLLTAIFGYETIIAYSPIPIPLVTREFALTLSSELNFFWWYFLSSITFSGVVAKLLGTSLSD